MLAPVYQLLFASNDSKYPWAKKPSLELTEDQIIISYKTYKTDNQSDMQKIIDEKLSPGENNFLIRNLIISCKYWPGSGISCNGP